MPEPDARALSRRAFLRTAGGGLATLSLASILAACSGANDAASPSASAGPDAVARFWSQQKKAGTVTMANWPYYMDRGKDAQGNPTHPTLDAFERATGITVDYLEVIESYEEFHAKLLPLLANGQSTGYDVIMTGYPKWLPLLIARGDLVELDHDLLPNFDANVAPKYQTASYDPGNRFGVPFQSGITGIGYNIDLTGREITSVRELFSDEWTGKVGMFRDTVDTPSIALLANGVDPPDSSEQDWQAAADLLTKQRDDGIVRQYYGQAYISALQTEEVTLSLAWGGDILQSQNRGYDNLRFVIPDEGGMLWTDDMAIPLGAEHPLDAIMLMDWFYRPEIAAMLASSIQGVSPVPAAQDLLRKQGDPVAESELVFPTAETYDRLHDYRTLTGDENDTWDNLFLPIYQS